MRAFSRLAPVSAIATVTVVSLALLSFALGAQGAQGAQRAQATKCDIKNFGCVNEKLYRGAQPKDQDFETSLRWA